ncbi:hypothetical protein FSP39_005231 [Pinctada imbricata]|uniref:Phosphoglycolate phosphatase n=1 Tax=Pinctada imbricata TaxID=66713 RepID=A0AA88Y994_PINIB|nr:hypothetical protein FSP39_005231 [Pinctada imbricata]
MSCIYIVILYLGVLWNGPDPIKGSCETVKALKEMGKRIFYVTNNSSKTRKEYTVKCNKLGFDATEDEIVCTSYIAALYLHNIGFKGKIYVVGNEGMGEELDNYGFNHCGIGPDPVKGPTDLHSFSTTELDPDVNCVLVGFDPHLSYNKMVKGASYARREGALFIATNEDSFLPLDGDVVIPGTGSIVSAVKVPARKEPIVMGKPEVNMFKALQQAYNLDPQRSMMVGDRCNTDIMMAHNCGMKSLLVMSGCTTQEELEKYKSDRDSYGTYIPTYVANRLGELLECL